MNTGIRYSQTLRTIVSEYNNLIYKLYSNVCIKRNKMTEQLHGVFSPIILLISYVVYRFTKTHNVHVYDIYVSY